MADQINVNADDRPAAPKTSTKPHWGRRLLTLLIATAAVGGFAVVVVYSYDKGKSSTADTAAPVITAQAGPTKIRPKEPGGMVVPNRDKQVYGRLNIAEKPDKIERLLPPPETVMEKPPALAAGTNRVAMPEKTPEQMAKTLAAIEPAAGKAKPPAAPMTRDGAKMAADKAPPAKESLMTEKPTETAKLVAPAKTPVVSSGAAFRIQLASVRSKKAAEQAWGRYKKSHASLFGKLESKIVRVDLKGKGTYYRLQAGPLADAKAARSLCSEAKKRKIGCIIVRP